MGKQKGKNLTKNDKAHTKEASPKPKEKEPPQAPLYLCSERKRVEILFKLD